MIENFEKEFLAFCRAKPADECFDCGSPSVCALGQFVNRFGYEGGSRHYYKEDPLTGRMLEHCEYPTRVYESVLGLNDGANSHINLDYYSFGKLVKRLEAAGVAS